MSFRKSFAWLLLGAVECAALAYAFTVAPRPLTRAVVAVRGGSGRGTARAGASPARRALPGGSRAPASLLFSERPAGESLRVEPIPTIPVPAPAGASRRGAELEPHPNVVPRDEALRLLFIAASHVRRGELEKAGPLLSAAYGAAKDDETRSRVRQWMGLGKLGRERGDLGLEDFTRAVTLDPSNHAAVFDMAAARLARGEARDAVRLLELSRQRTPALWIVPAAQGRAYEALGESALAEKALREAVALSPQRWLPRLYLASHYKARGNRAELRRVLEHVDDTDARYESEGPAPFGYFVDFPSREQFSNLVRELKQELE